MGIWGGLNDVLETIAGNPNRSAGQNGFKDIANTVVTGLGNAVTGQHAQPSWMAQQNTDQNTANYNNYQAAGQAINQASNPSQITGSYTGGGGGGGGGVGANLSQYDSGINQVNNSIGRLPGQLDIANANINGAYNSSLQGINTAKTNANQSFDNSNLQNGQSYLTNKNQIADQASSGLRGLMRMLGANGAGGSSDALYNAPQAVADQASLQRAGAGQAFAKNASGLNTNWQNFLGQDKQDRTNLDSWKTNQLNSAQAQSDTTKNSLLSSLAQLASQRASAAGGNASAAAQPYIDQANALNGQIDQLGRLAPTYNGQVASYQAPTLDSFNPGAGTAASGMTQGTTGSNNPYLAMLLGQQKDKNSPLGA